MINSLLNTTNNVLINTLGLDTNLPNVVVHMMDIDSRYKVYNYVDIYIKGNTDTITVYLQKLLRYCMSVHNDINIKQYHVLIDTPSYMSTDIIKELKKHKKDIAGIGMLKLYYPIYNINKNIVRGIHCINKYKNDKGILE